MKSNEINIRDPYIMPYGIEGQMRVFTESYPYSGEDLSSYIRK